MLLIYTILYFISTMFYYMKLNIIASIIMILLAIFLCFSEIRLSKRVINVRGLFALGFIGGFGLSLLKLSKLSQDYNMLTFIAVYIAYLSLYLGVFLKNRKVASVMTNNQSDKLERSRSVLLPQEILVIVLLIVTFMSFIVEVIMLRFIPLFTLATPHAYSTFHVFMLHYITTFYAFIPCFALCNYFVEPERKTSRVFIVISYVYVIIMALLLVSRSQLILSIVLSLFIIMIYRTRKTGRISLSKRSLTIVSISIVIFLALYLAITVSRAHDVEYLNGIFEMKNEKTPIFITQPYMYIAHNFENLNYMINNVFRLTFGRRILYPFFTLTFVKKFFPIVVDSPYYIIKEELSTVTIIYDFYYDFGLVGVAVFCFIIGYIGKALEDRAYRIAMQDEPDKNNYTLILFSLYCYFMLFSFFQTYFSLTDTWVYIIILSLIMLLFNMNKSFSKKVFTSENQKKTINGTKLESESYMEGNDDYEEKYEKNS